METKFSSRTRKVSVAAALLVTVLPLLASRAGFSWIALPFLAPGFFAEGLFFQVGLRIGNPAAHWLLAGALNFLFFWFVFLTVCKFVGRHTNQRKREQG